MANNSISPELKFQLVLETLAGDKTPGQLSKLYRVNPNSIALWKKLFLDARTLSELCAVAAERIAYYNNDRRHSAIDYLAPMTYINRRLACSLAPQLPGENLSKIWGAPLNPLQAFYL